MSPHEPTNQGEALATSSPGTTSPHDRLSQLGTVESVPSWDRKQEIMNEDIETVEVCECCALAIANADSSACRDFHNHTVLEHPLDPMAIGGHYILVGVDGMREASRPTECDRCRGAVGTFGALHEAEIHAHKTVQVQASHVDAETVTMHCLYAIDLEQTINGGTAATIAAWWQSPGCSGDALAALASGSEVPVDAVHDQAVQQRRLVGDGSLDALHLDALVAWAWVRMGGQV